MPYYLSGHQCHQHRCRSNCVGISDRMYPSATSLVWTVVCIVEGQQWVQWPLQVVPATRARRSPDMPCAGCAKMGSGRTCENETENDPQKWYQQRGMSLWWSLLELLPWCPVFKSSYCNSFEDRSLVDFIYGWPIFKWIAETWRDSGGLPGITPCAHVLRHSHLPYWDRKMVAISQMTFSNKCVFLNKSHCTRMKISLTLKLLKFVS